MNFKDVRVSAHTFRHTFCHRLAMSGMSAFAIQKLMRHKNINVAMWGNELREQPDNINNVSRFRNLAVVTVSSWLMYLGTPVLAYCFFRWKEILSKEQVLGVSSYEYHCGVIFFFLVTICFGYGDRVRCGLYVRIIKNYFLSKSTIQ
ncbi:tyrosine-type recombinase/integrase [Domibacillus iocasae]|uniref:tyrosine-type recombinase/integrase n=1 Tax=Domibacillus iocasae TaxID=1714016 RepID=UPI000A57FDAB|nr:site-specific integrase [Domibacillus iocasae]